MAQTARTLAALLGLLADNATKDISAEDQRDVLVSTFGAWAGMYVADGVTPQSGITTTPEKLICFTDNFSGPSGVITPDHTDDSLEVLLNGDYLALAQLSFSGSNNQSFEIHAYVDGVESPFGTHRKLGAGGDEGSAVIIAPLVGANGLLAAEKVTLYINTVPSGTGEVTVIDGQIFMIKIG